MQERVACIEKWAAIADICRCMHNYNGVLQICAAFVNSSVYRLKKTWEKLSKQVEFTVTKSSPDICLFYHVCKNTKFLVNQVHGQCVLFSEFHDIFINKNLMIISRY